MVSVEVAEKVRDYLVRDHAEILVRMRRQLDREMLEWLGWRLGRIEDNVYGLLRQEEKHGDYRRA